MLVSVTLQSSGLSTGGGRGIQNTSVLGKGGGRGRDAISCHNGTDIGWVHRRPQIEYTGIVD